MMNSPVFSRVPARRSWDLGETKEGPLLPSRSKIVSVPLDRCQLVVDDIVEDIDSVAMNLAHFDELPSFLDADAEEWLVFLLDYGVALTNNRELLFCSQGSSVGASDVVPSHAHSIRDLRPERLVLGLQVLSALRFEGF